MIVLAEKLLHLQVSAVVSLWESATRSLNLFVDRVGHCLIIKVCMKVRWVPNIIYYQISQVSPYTHTQAQKYGASKASITSV